jgi:hypothetical protein
MGLNLVTIYNCRIHVIIVIFYIRYIQVLRLPAKFGDRNPTRFLQVREAKYPSRYRVQKCRIPLFGGFVGLGLK